MKRLEGFEHLYNKHEKDTCIIVANGPGLDNIPIRFLRRYITFGCNRITLKTPEFVPTYYSCLGINQLDTHEKRKTIYATLEHPDCKAAFINRLMIHYFPFENVHSILGGRTYGMKETAFFSSSPLEITGLAASMVYVNLQIAFYMGFDTVLLVGLDHRYPEGTKRHFYDDSEFPQFEQAPGPVYNNDNDTWRSVVDIVFNAANEVYNEYGRRIINISSPSDCTIFRKEALSDWFHPDQ